MVKSFSYKTVLVPAPALHTCTHVNSHGGALPQSLWPTLATSSFKEVGSSKPVYLFCKLAIPPNLMEAFPKFQFLLSEDFSLCQVDISLLSTVFRCGSVKLDDNSVFGNGSMAVTMCVKNISAVALPFALGRAFHSNCLEHVCYEDT